MATQPSNAILKGLREDYPDLAEFDNDILIEAVRQADFEDMDEETYLKALTQGYPEPQESIGTTLKKLPGEIVSELKKDVVAPGVAAGKMAGLPALEKPLAELEAAPDFAALLERGFSPQIARHVMRQRIGTMESLASTLGEEAAAGKEATVRGAAAYGSGALGGAAEGLPVAKTIIGTLLKHARAGAFGFGGYEGVKAAGEGKSAKEIMDVSMQAAGIGAIAGPAIIGIFGRIGKTIKTIGNIPRYMADGASVVEARLKQSLATSADQFAERFQGDWLRTRFGDLPILADPNADPNVIAATIIARVLGTDVAENTAESTLAKIGEKVAFQRRYARIDPSLSEGVMRPAEPPPLPEMDVLNMQAQQQQAIPMPLESPGAAISNPLQRAPIPPRQALDIVIEAGKLQQQVTSEQLIPQSPRTALPPEPGQVQLPEPGAPATPPAAPMAGMEPPTSMAAPPEPIVPEARPTLSAQPPAGPMPRPAAIVGEGGLVPEPTVLPRDPSLGEQFPAFTPPSDVPTPKMVTRIPSPSKTQTSPARLTPDAFKPEPGYAYHATNAERLWQIAETGELKPHKPNYGTEQEAWPDGSKAMRAYFMEGDKATNIHQFSPTEGSPVVIRIKSTGLMKEKGTGDLFTNKKIPVSRIEYLDENNQWVPLERGR